MQCCMEECVRDFMLSDSTVTDVKLGLTLTRHWRTFINLLIWMMAQVRILNFMKHRLRQDAQLSGFVANDEKSQWVPVQSGELLGDVLNLQMGTLQVLQKRVDAFLHVLQDVLATVFFSAWKVARYTVLLASISLVLGPVVRLLARSLYHDILHVVSADTQKKVLFWQ